MYDIYLEIERMAAIILGRTGQMPAYAVISDSLKSQFGKQAPTRYFTLNLEFAAVPVNTLIFTDGNRMWMGKCLVEQFPIFNPNFNPETYKEFSMFNFLKKTSVGAVVPSDEFINEMKKPSMDTDIGSVHPSTLMAPDWSLCAKGDRLKLDMLFVMSPMDKPREGIESVTFHGWQNNNAVVMDENGALLTVAGTAGLSAR